MQLGTGWPHLQLVMAEVNLYIWYTGCQEAGPLPRGVQASQVVVGHIQAPHVFALQQCCWQGTWVS